MKGAKEKISNMASAAKERIDHHKAKAEEKIEKASTRTEGEKDTTANERRKEAPVETELHEEKANHDHALVLDGHEQLVATHQHHGHGHRYNYNTGGGEVTMPPASVKDL